MNDAVTEISNRESYPFDRLRTPTMLPRGETIPDLPGRWAKAAEIVADDDFRDLLPFPGADERDEMLLSLHNEGCPEPLYVWKWKQRLILLIGYRFFPVLRDYDIPFRIIEKEFPDRSRACHFVIHYHLGRGLLTPLTLSYFRGLRYQSDKLPRGGDRRSENFRKQIGPRRTARVLAELYHVDPETIREDGRFSRAVDTLVAVGGEMVRPFLFARETRLTRSSIIALARRERDEQERLLKALVTTGRLRQFERGSGERKSIVLPCDPAAFVQTLLSRDRSLAERIHLELGRAAALPARQPFRSRTSPRPKEASRGLPLWRISCSDPGEAGGRPGTPSDSSFRGVGGRSLFLRAR